MTEFNRNFIAALNRKTQETPPIWIMRQAGRYLPEYRKVRSNFKNFLDIQNKHQPGYQEIYGHHQNDSL